MSRIRVKVTDYLHDDDPRIAAAARAAYTTALVLHELIEARDAGDWDDETSGEVGPEPDETSQPHVGVGTTALTFPEPRKKRAPVGVDYQALDSWCRLTDRPWRSGGHGRPSNALIAEYRAAMGETA